MMTDTRTSIASAQTTISSNPQGMDSGAVETPRRRIVLNMLAKDVQLNTCQNAWKPGMSRRRVVVDQEVQNTQDVVRKFRSILNKLTPEKFDRLIHQVNELDISTEERLEGVVDLLFEKAISEPSFASMYAKMCCCLSTLNIQSRADPSSTVKFRSLVLSRCRKEFHKEGDVEIQLDSAASEDIQSGQAKARRRSIGNIKFFAELYKLRMVAEVTMHGCCEKLLINQDEESLESLCQLLTTAGKDMDSGKSKLQMTQYFRTLEKIIREQTTSSRIRCLLQDVVDLRSNNWVSRRAGQGPQTIQQIHQEAELEEKEGLRKVQQQLPWNNREQRERPQREREQRERPQREREQREREQREREQREREQREREQREREQRDREQREREQRERQQREREQREREQREREQREREQRDREQREREQRERQQREREQREREQRERQQRDREQRERQQREREQRERQQREREQREREQRERQQRDREQRERQQREREQRERQQRERQQRERELKERQQREEEKREKEQTERQQREREQTERQQREREQTERQQREREQTERQQREREQTERQQREREQTERQPKKRGQRARQQRMRKQREEEKREREKREREHEEMTMKMSEEELSVQLDRLLLDNTSSEQEIFDWVEKNLDESERRSSPFLRALMTSVCRSAVIALDAKYYMDPSVMDRRLPVLVKYLQSDSEQQLRALSALQALDVTLGHPPHLLHFFFSWLADNDVISADAFSKCQSSRDPEEQPGKKSLAAFFVYLQEAREELTGR